MYSLEAESTAKRVFLSGIPCWFQIFSLLEFRNVTAKIWEHNFSAAMRVFGDIMLASNTFHIPYLESCKDSEMVMHFFWPKVAETVWLGLQERNSMYMTQDNYFVSKIIVICAVMNDGMC